MQINRRLRLLHRKYGTSSVQGWQAAQALGMTSTAFLDWAIKCPQDRDYRMEQIGPKYRVLPLRNNFRADADKAAELVLSAIATVAHSRLIAAGNLPVHVINLGISTLVQRGVLRAPMLNGAEQALELRFQREAA